MPTFSKYLVEKVVVVDFTKQMNCLAENIYYESGSETFEGKMAVAQVTINRTANPNFPKDICGVVYQKNNGTCQFSWTCMAINKNKDQYLWEESQYIAKKALTEPIAHDKIKTQNALYYHANYVNPGWNKQKVVARIGHHIFYANI
jgi:spore germination cell wall hydrolase CwlJ-like protein